MNRATRDEPEAVERHGRTVVALSLSGAALVLMLGDWLVHPTGDHSELGLTQLVIALVCLVIGVLVVRDRTRPGDGGVVIDLRDTPADERRPQSARADEARRVVAPRQVPDARASGTFSA